MSAIAFSSDNRNSKLQSLLDEAKRKFAPDKRTMVFHVDGSLDGNRAVLTGELHSADLKRQLLEFLKSKETFEIVDSIAVLPSVALGEKIFGVVSVSVANIRTKPGHAEELATQAILGTTLRLLKKHDDWYYVQTPDDYLGWTDDVIAVFDKTEHEKWLREPKVIVTSTYAHAFASSDKNGEIVSDVVAGNILKFVRDGGSFFEVEYPKTRSGFVPKDNAMLFPDWLSQAKDTPERIITTAKRFMGVPYLWGGTSAKQMDCSGFTKTVYFLNGVVLPRDASQQALIGEPVSIEDNFRHLKKGDLVFFGRKATGERGERVTHVGIYIENFKFIHEGGDVRINSFNPTDPDYSEYRTKSLLRATRVIGVGEERGVRRLNTISYYKTHEQ